MDREERGALQSILADKEIIIKPADKGGATVIMDRFMYQKKINHILEQAVVSVIINKKTQQFLIKSDPIIPVFYTLPKIHKRLDNPPGRPIVASTDSILSPLYILLEKVLAPLVKNTLSFICIQGISSIPLRKWVN
ncbi:unnamed protein product [Ranitomeya imitator]|uniref:Reverse transcriptase n=1 Tax=Ranitomeya imitator TaxID=111125 RepID=A0ABN9LEX9_9NEOB|nr:unnamed protein product [Ranitomeya imitator]